MVGDLLFDIPTPLGFAVRCSRRYWEEVILQKHPVLAGRDGEIAVTLADPDLVRQSRRDPAVLLFYRGGIPRWTCAVARCERQSGFLITAYPTEAVKIGELVWTRSG